MGFFNNLITAQVVGTMNELEAIKTIVTAKCNSSEVYNTFVDCNRELTRVELTRDKTKSELLYHFAAIYEQLEKLKDECQSASDKKDLTSETAVIDKQMQKMTMLYQIVDDKIRANARKLF